MTYVKLSEFVVIISDHSEQFLTLKIMLVHIYSHRGSSEEFQQEKHTF